MKFWFVLPLTMFMLGPLWLERFESYMDRQDGSSTADGGTGIPPHYADGGTGIPPH